MISIMAAIIRRDLLIGWRGLSDTLAGVGYFAVIIALLPLAIGPDPEVLHLIGPAMLWVAALVASLPQMERFFSREAADGSLDHLILTPAPAACCSCQGHCRLAYHRPAACPDDPCSGRDAGAAAQCHAGDHAGCADRQCCADAAWCDGGGCGHRRPPRFNPDSSCHPAAGDAGADIRNSGITGSG